MFHALSACLACRESFDGVEFVGRHQQVRIGIRYGLEIVFEPNPVAHITAVAEFIFVKTFSELPGSTIEIRFF